MEMNPMPSKHWLQLYAVFALSIGALMFEHQMNLTSLDHKIVMLLIVVVIYGLLGLWIKSNEDVIAG
jgi:hypothetical protein